jgi:membrane protease YdiL (CAAX protease family)
MLVAAVEPLQVAQAIDVAVMVCGGLCTVGFVIRLIRRDEWRNPLAGVRRAALWRTVAAPAQSPTPDELAPGAPEPPAARVLLGPEGPTLLHIILALFAYLIAAQLVTALVLHGQDLQAATQPGTQAWYLYQAADTLAKLLASALVIFMLARHPLFPLGGTRSGLGRQIGIGLLTGVALTAITFVQLQMGAIIWQWLHEGQELPLHPVLLALKESQVGWWGPAVLVVAAVVAAPLAEELFFRGLVLGVMWRLTGRAWIAVITSGVAFGAIHGQPQDILPLCTMGIALGYVRLRTRSLVPTIVAHALFNARTMILAILFPEMISP